MSDESRKERIKAIALQLVAGQIRDGKLNPDDTAALRAATKQAVEDAKAAYSAAEEYLCG